MDQIVGRINRAKTFSRKKASDACEDLDIGCGVKANDDEFLTPRTLKAK